MPDRLVVDLGGDGRAAVMTWPESGLPQEVAQAPLKWPLDGGALEDLRWYLEDYLIAPFGVWEERGPTVRKKLAGWGDQVFRAVFGVGPARDAYQRARDQGLEVVFRSAEPGLLGLPWELMRDGGGPVALRAGGISRSLPVDTGAGTLEVPGGRLRVLMLISRPRGTADVGYQMVARPLLERLDAVRGDVDLTVLRPSTFDALAETVRRAAEAGEPFHVVHFDGHGRMPGRSTGDAAADGHPAMMIGPGEGVLAFELPGWDSHPVGASKVAAALAEGRVPVVVLNACQSGAMGKDLEASVATALLTAGCAAVVAMAYSVYAVAAAEFMAAFYESLFAGDSVGQAVTAGRRRLSSHDGRPSPKGEMPLADWLVPVHYMRAEVCFPDALTRRPATRPSLDAALDEIRAAPSQDAPTQDPLAAVGAFVGRDDLFYQLEVAARQQRVVVLTGPGGTGKTELAKGFARWWRDTSGVDDPRLVLWHSFESGVASFGLDGVIAEIGLAVLGADLARLDGPQRLAAVNQLLERYRALLVWDNFESVREMPDAAGATSPLEEGGCAQLRDFLAWVSGHSASTVLITSRAREDWLGDVRRIPVGGLNRAEAAQYADHLLASFPAAQKRREQRSFGELLEWLDGHPLAMRLTLPRLESHDPAALLAGLRGTTAVLTAEDSREGRLSSLGACVAYSFAHLSEQTRRLLPALSLLHGVADVNVLTMFSAAVKAVPGRFAGFGRDEWASVLQDATRVGLLTSLDGVMYRIHPALPGYLAARWHAENPGEYAHERQACMPALQFACAFLSARLIGQIESGDAAVAYAIIRLQRRTFGAMLGHALDHHTWDEATPIVRALAYYWDARGLSQEADAWAERILDATTGSGQDPLEAAGWPWLEAVLIRGRLRVAAGQMDQAVRLYQRSLAFLQGQPETDWTREAISVIYHRLGYTAHARGRLDEAEDWYRQSLDVSEESGDRPGMAGTYHQIGLIAHARGRLDEAEDWYRQSLAIHEEFGERSHRAGLYHDLGTTALRRGRLDEAEEAYLRSLAISMELGNRPSMAITYHQLANTASERGQLGEAEDWYRQSLTIFQELDDRPNIAGTYHSLGVIALERSRLDEAEDWLRQAIQIHEELGLRALLAGGYLHLGNIAYRRERMDEAENWYRQSLTIDEEFGDRPGAAKAYHNLGMTARQQGRLDEAENWYRQSLAVKEELGNRHGMALTYAELGLLAEARAQPRAALEWNIRCMALFSRLPRAVSKSVPSALARLTRQLGVPAVEEAWQQVTGQPMPQPVRDYITSHHDQPPPGGQP